MMMRGQTHFGSAVVFIVLSSCIVLLSGMYALDDSSEPLSNLYLDSSFDETSLNAGAPDPLTIASDLNPSTSDDSRGMLDPYYTDSSDDLLLQSPESDLLLSSNAACSFDSSFLDENLGGAGADLELFGKREAPHQACKTSQEGSKKSGNNPEDILNNLPIFQPPHFSDFIEDMHVCNPYLVGDRDIPVCWFGAPHLPVKSDDMRMPGTLVGCSAYDRYSVSGCPSASLLLCCRVAHMDDDLANALTESAGIRQGITLNSDSTPNYERCSAFDCVDALLGTPKIPFNIGPHLPAVTHTPS